MKPLIHIDRSERLRPRGSSVTARAGAIMAGYIALYVLLDAMSYVQPVLKLGITPWNPQAGLTLAFLLTCGPRWFPATAIAALLAEMVVRGGALSSPFPLIASLWIALGYGGLAWLLRRWGVQEPLETAHAATRLALASILATLVVACGYVALFTLSGALPHEAALGSVARYWVGDVNGILTLTPLVLYAGRWREAVNAVRGHSLLLFAQFGATFLTLWVVFGIAATDQLRFFYPLFVPMIWIAMRWGVPGAIIAALTIQMGVVIGSQDAGRAPPLVDLQFLMLTLSLTALLLGAVVTERAAVLKRIARREAEQRALLATAPDAVLVIDSDQTIQSANPAALRLFGDCANQKLSELLPSLALEEAEGRATLEGFKVDGEAFPADIAWARLDAPAREGFLVTVRDATERQRAEAQLRERDTALSRAMRFAVAGELASALAHELKQPITALVSYLEAAEILAGSVEKHDQRLKETLKKAAKEIMHASDILRWLRDFYREGNLKHERVEIPVLCQAMSQTFQERMRRVNAHIITRVDAAIPAVDADSTQLEVVLHNLLANALDAVTQAPKPWRRVELRAERAGPHVIVSVEDSGPGISGEIAEKLFEPFVTSKSDGMGLGLAISRSLLRARGGDLSFEPRGTLGGARFIVRVPIRASQEVAL